MESPLSVPPELCEGESYHVFCSYSNTDQQWTHALIQQLEDTGLTVCYHERDFTPGRSILENMSESIQQSQKVLLVLSAEFLRSRWCLLEANMSLFRDCLQTKPIVPVLLQRDVSIPLHLSHLTYLDVQSPDFIQQLLRVLCTPNQELQASTVVPYQPPSLYNGKSLEPLPAANRGQVKMWISWLVSGVWSNVVPDQLRLILQQPERFREAISIVNTATQTTLSDKTFCSVFLIIIAAILLLLSVLPVTIFYLVKDKSKQELNIILSAISIPISLFIVYMAVTSGIYEKRRFKRELQNAVGKANSLLFEEKVLMGAESNFKLLLVYVCVDGCRQELSALSPDLEFFHKAMLEYSSAYTCCLAKKFFPFQSISSICHLEETMCFCQYVIYQLSMKETAAHVVEDSEDV